MRSSPSPSDAGSWACRERCPLSTASWWWSSSRCRSPSSPPLTHTVVSQEPVTQMWFDDSDYQQHKPLIAVICLKGFMSNICQRITQGFKSYLSFDIPKVSGHCFICFISFNFFFSSVLKQSGNTFLHRTCWWNVSFLHHKVSALWNPTPFAVSLFCDSGFLSSHGVTSRKTSFVFTSLNCRHHFKIKRFWFSIVYFCLILLLIWPEVHMTVFCLLY